VFFRATDEDAEGEDDEDDEDDEAEAADSMAPKELYEDDGDYEERLRGI